MKNEKENNNQLSLFDITEFSFGRKFGMLGRLFHGHLSKRLEFLGIKKHFSILILVDRIGDQCNQKFIANTLNIDPVTMVGNLDELVERKFVKRVQNPSDRREHWIQLTPKGKKAIPEIKATVNMLNAAVLEGLSPLEVKRLHKYLGVVYENLQKIPKPE
jgi:MarR family transcriptional regulator for hemolysin